MHLEDRTRTIDTTTCRGRPVVRVDLSIDPPARVRPARSVLLALRSVAPVAVVPTLSALLSQELGTDQVQLHLTDQMRTLHLISGSALTEEPALPQPMDGSPAGQVVLTRRPAVAADPSRSLSVLVPVTVRGQRLGVLRGSLPGRAASTAMDPDPGPSVDALSTAADVLAHVVIEASAGSDVYEVTRRSNRFTVATDMPWQLLPGRAVSTPAHTPAGRREPARTCRATRSTGQPTRTL